MPLTDFVFSLLESRKAAAASEYVVAGNGKAGYLIEPRHQVQQVRDASGHDLRHSYITIAESIDISACALKRRVNHKISNDVTAGYIVNDVERLREPMQRIASYLLNCMGVRPSAEVVALESKRLMTI